MHRRNFLKTTVSLAALNALSGCSNLPPKGETQPRVVDTSCVIRPGLNGKWDARRAAAPHVIANDFELSMFYWGQLEKKYSICRAKAKLNEPTKWRPAGVVLKPVTDRELNRSGPSFPFVLPLNETEWLLYYHCSGANGLITCLAKSEDGGESFQYLGEEPILSKEADHNGGTGSCFVLRHENEFRMYYTAFHRTRMPAPRGDRFEEGKMLPQVGIGFATSTNGYEWSQPLNDWIIPPPLHDFEQFTYIVSKPYVWKDGDLWRMTVNCFSEKYRIHELTSPDGIQWNWLDPTGKDTFGVGAEGQFDSNQRSYPTMITRGDQTHCWYTGNNFGLESGIGHGVLRNDS